MITKSEFTSNQSEDCLYLNIWTPKQISKPLAVMIWIHGGAFVSGSSSEPFYNGNTLSDVGNVIVVTLNYRLGILGFMTSDYLKDEDPTHPTSGNYGLLDQNMAIKWVYENISNFGGDPSNITIFGESAGSMSVCLHMIMPISKGLFKRVIMQSGPCTNSKYSNDSLGNLLLPNFNYNFWKQNGEKWMKQLNCRDIKCMRELPAVTIIQYMKKENIYLYPTVDGYVIPDDPTNMFKSGNYHKSDVLIGTNLSEGTLWTAEYIYMKTEEYKYMLNYLFPIHSNIILDMYSIEKHTFPAAAYSAFFSDWLVLCPSSRLLELLEENNKNKNISLYEYYFTHIPEYLPNYLKFLAAFHGAEIIHVFDNPYDTFVNPHNVSLTDEERNFSLAIQQYWTSFAKDGIPNAKNHPDWPSRGNDAKPYINLNAFTIHIEKDLHKNECELYKKILFDGA
jgi:para-nitrobenzyl esterase